MPEIIVNETLGWQERGLHYGDGLFETLLKLEGQIPLWNEHYQRLRKGCHRLRIDLPEEAWLVDRIARETQETESSVVKLIVTRGSGGRGLKLPVNNRPSIFVFKYPYTRIMDKEMALDVAICDTRLPINRNLAGIKHLNRLDYVLAALELETKGMRDEGILLDTDGFLVEGIISNLFFCLQSQVYTPSLEMAGVEGIMRKQILNYFESQGVRVEVGRFSAQLLMQASECFMCNSVQGVRPIRSLDQSQFETGPLTRNLMKLFNTGLRYEQ
ncbi:MAG: aminodeoxychorismate lyase [Gammaproteobacteria bacterium]